jgi:hypothetical protein
VGMYGDFCRAFNASTRDGRHPACIEAERKAQGALIQADYDGFARALRDQGVAALEAEIMGFKHAATYPDHCDDDRREALANLEMALAALRGEF